MNEFIPCAAHVIPDSGQYYLFSADESGVYEYTTRDFIHYSEPRPLIKAADAEGITGWASPHLSGDTLTVTVDTAEGRHGIRVFSTQEYMPGISRFVPLTGILTPPDWDCTDGMMFAGFLFFTRRTEAGAEIWVQPLRVGYIPMGEPYRLTEGEAPVLWPLAARDGFAEPTAMLFFSRGRAHLAKALSPYEPIWEEIPLPMEVEGVSAAVYEEMDGNFMARIIREDGTAHFCYLEWMEGGCALIPREGI